MEDSPQAASEEEIAQITARESVRARESLERKILIDDQCAKSS